jgi:hypothetical protein
VASKENGLEVNADKTKYVVMSRDQTAGRSHSIKTDNSSFEIVQIFGNYPNVSNYIQEEIKNRLKPRENLPHQSKTNQSNIDREIVRW